MVEPLNQERNGGKDEDHSEKSDEQSRIRLAVTLPQVAHVGSNAGQNK